MRSRMIAEYAYTAFELPISVRSEKGRVNEQPGASAPRLIDSVESAAGRASPRFFWLSLERLTYACERQRARSEIVARDSRAKAVGSGTAAPWTEEPLPAPEVLPNRARHAS
jgi:hypothetical protein